MTELSHRHYLTVAETLDRAMRRTRCAVFTLGGHAYETANFLRAKPGPLRERYAGDFVADPHTLNPARVRELSSATIARWRTTRERRLLAELRDSSSGATGLPACVAAANRGAVRLLVVPEEEIVPGFACSGCGRLALTAGPCLRCGIPLTPAADIVEELVVGVIQHGGDVEPAGEILRPEGVAAKLRFAGAAR